MKYCFEDSIGKLTAEISSKFGAGLADVFKENKFVCSSLEWMTLSFLMNKGPQTQIQLAEVIKRNKVYTKRLVDKMESKQLVCRRILILDKRYNEVSITETGIEYYKQLLPLVESYLEKTYSVLTKKELAQLISLLKKI
jgi:DNA-binding MarR family transcriptional regulator